MAPLYHIYISTDVRAPTPFASAMPRGVQCRILHPKPRELLILTVTTDRICEVSLEVAGCRRLAKFAEPQKLIVSLGKIVVSVILENMEMAALYVQSLRCV